MMTCYHWQDEQQASGVTDLEKQLAHFCMLLEKKWGSDHDNSCTYIYPNGTPIPLMPYIIKEWAHAIVRSSCIYFLL
jgi:hypothetical protein